MKIAIQGEKGCFHEVAARQYFSYDEIDIVPCSTFDLTLNTLKAGNADFAVMAIENARSGSILYNYTLLRESGMKILGEHNLRIRQNLMALPGQSITEINEIRSHPIAIAQCMTYLNQFPGITLIESDDTAGSAREISETKEMGVAAIAAAAAAEIYGLEILAEGIETYKQNYTRFMIVGKEEQGNYKGNKVSVCFSTGHKPGSLARVIIEPKMEIDIINSYLRMAEQMPFNWMPTFPEITGDSRRMNSNHAVATVIDAYNKGLRGFDLEKAYESCRKGIMEKTLAPWSGKPAGELDRFYREHGYIPALKEDEKETIPEVHSFERRQPVAVTLGTSYDEWCLAQIARELGKTEDYEYFLKSSYNYRNLFNAETDFFHPKDSKGNFIMPFDYKFSGGQGARGFYDENNAWTYRWDVQHNIADLISLMGGDEAFVSNLDATFVEPLGKSKFEFYAQLPDQTGNVGQFSMANEPSLHIPYLYNYAGQPWKTQKMTRALLTYWFRNDLMGVPGDEDGGGTSAFVVFSQLGFYPVTPGSPSYNIGSPVFTESVVKLDNGKEFRIKATNCSEDNKYIQSAKLNGKEWNKPWFSHDDIKDGGVLELVMGNRANMAWGSSPDAVPPSAEKLN